MSPDVTLILSLITSEFVCHVSDRQLTDTETGDQLMVKAAKTVIAPAARLMVSYTGLASIASLTTDEWLMRTLWDIRDSDDFFTSVAEAAADALRKTKFKPSQNRKLMFICSGWLGDDWGTDAPLPEKFIARSYCSVVSNFHDFESGIVLPEAGHEFTHRTRPLMPDERFFTFPAGATLVPAEARELQVNLAAALRSARGKERAAAVAMLRVVERVSRRDSTVGGGAFISALPVNFMPAGPETEGLNVLGVRWGLPESPFATFVHVPNEPTEVVESPGIIADPFAGKLKLTITRGDVPNVAGAGGVPEEGTAEMRVIALRSSDDIRKLFAASRDERAS